MNSDSFNEIITLQIGNYSNYVCSHFWNLQESLFVYKSDAKNNAELPDINHDFLFREGFNAKHSLTFTPRAVSIDLKDNVNVFRSVNSFPDRATTSDKIENLERYESEKNQPSRFIKDLDDLNAKNQSDELLNYRDYDMESEVKYWSDYMNLKYHDRTYLPIPPYLQNMKPSNQNDEEDADESEDFGLYTDGINVAKDKDFNENFYESVRHFCEEANFIQGFQIFIDSFNGFSGLSSECMSMLNEEYTKKPIFTYLPIPYFDGKYSKKIQLNRLMNTSLCLFNLLRDNKSNICVPMSLFNAPFSLNKQLKPVVMNDLNCKTYLAYHTSSIIATLVDCLTTPFRKRSNSINMNELFDQFDNYKYKLASLQSVFPLNVNKTNYLFDYLQEADLKASTWFTPYSNNYSYNHLDTPGAYQLSSRGIRNEHVINPLNLSVFKKNENAQTVFDLYLKEIFSNSTVSCHNTYTPIKIKFPYPNIINLKNCQNKVKDMSMLTILQMNKSSKCLIEQFNQNITKSSLSKDFGKLVNSGLVELDDLDDLIDFNRELEDSF